MSRARDIGDARERERITVELDRNLLVEAGAGSGKTQKLAERMAAGIATGRYELDRMAAVTFTRKAAAELRGRFQMALEAELGRGGGEDRRARISAALANLERFFAGTIHAFCARLLRERPVEAGVSPGFTELDDAEEALLRRRSWRDYRGQARASGDVDLLELLDAGMTARQLDKAFETVCLYEDVDFLPGDAPLPDATGAWHALESFWMALSALLPDRIETATTCPTQQRADRFSRQWRAVLRGDRRPTRLADLLRIWESQPKATLKWWPNAAGKRAEALHAELRTGTVVPYLTAWRQHLYRRCVALLMKARSAARAGRLAQNALSFNDLLLLTASVLRSNAEVRHALQRKFHWLFVDEFQDTDPIQAEIMFLLAADERSEPRASSLEPRAPSPEPTDLLQDWRAVTLRPGALFVVGDPKQSIYRFRRADIEIYNEVRAKLAGSDGRGVLSLTTNFRSLPGLCEWANVVFAKAFPEAPTPQSPMFAPLTPFRAAKSLAPAVALLDLADVADSDQLAHDEARRIARYVRAEVTAGRRQFGDFLILTRKKKSLRPYAAALEALQVPIEVTGAGAFDESEEVREIALLLAALADPQDAVSLTGVLRGALFGLSDAELFAFRQAGGALNLFSRIETTDAGARRVCDAMDTLRRWHQWITTLPAGAALERVLDDSGYLALAATSRGGVEAGDLLHAVDRVRTVMEAGFTLAEAADALAAWCGLDDEGPEESTEVDSLPLEPGRRDVVRLMNLHKAKGLEASVVFLADPLGGFEPRVDVRVLRDGPAPVGYFQIQEDNPNSFSRKVLAEPAGWATYKQDEEAFLTAEVHRLLYVAATRAKDLLVVGRWPGRAGNRKPAWTLLLAHLSDAPVLPIPEPVASPAFLPFDLGPGIVQEAAAASERAHHDAERPSWAVTSVTAEVKRLPRFALGADETASTLDATSTILPDTVSHRADAGQAWGTLVHGLLEHAMRHPEASASDLHRLGLWLTMDEPALRRVLDRAVETALAVVTSPDLRAAREAADAQEEVPFAVTLPGPFGPSVLTGAIDLVHRDANGWRVVDYKTDREGSDAALAAKYAEQVRAYEDAWRRITGEAVTTAIVSARRD